MIASLASVLLAGLLLAPPAHAQSRMELSKEGWTQRCTFPADSGVKDAKFLCSCLYERLVREVPAAELYRAWNGPAAERESFFTTDPRVVALETGCDQLDASFGGKPTRDPAIEAFLAENGFYTFQLTTDGVYYLLSNPGQEPRAAVGTTVTLRYTALPLDGEVVASSDADGAPLTMKVGAGQMIRGMELALPLFGKGGKGVILLPYTLAYGERGLPPVVAPRAAFMMQIEVLDVR